MKADIQMKEDVCMKQDKVYQQMLEEANQMKGEEKLLKRDIRERNQQKNSIWSQPLSEFDYAYSNWLNIW